MAVSKNDLFDSAREILAKVLKIKPEEIQLQSTLQDDLGIDSVDFWDIVAEFDRKYGIKMAIPEAAALRTVADLLLLVEKKRKATS